MRNKLILFGQVLVICLFVLCGCQKKEEIAFESKTIHGRNFDKTVKVVIVSLKNWKESEVSRIFRMDEEHDDNFFGENALVVVAFKTTSGYEIMDINIFKKGRHLIVEINGNNTSTGAIDEVVLALAVKKEDIAGRKKVNIETNLSIM